MRLLIAILLALAASIAGAKGKETLEFRKDKLQIPECGAPYEDDPGSGIITLLPENIVCLAVTIVDGKVELSIPPKGAKPDTLLVLKLWHDPHAGKSYLSVHNPLDHFLAYKANLLRAGSANSTAKCNAVERSLEHGLRRSIA